jgi:hypothetical protein
LDPIYSFDFTEAATGAQISARPSKIVAGLEVSKTHELLQAIGKALDKKVFLFILDYFLNYYVMNIY